LGADERLRFVGTKPLGLLPRCEPVRYAAIAFVDLDLNIGRRRVTTQRFAIRAALA
jgi:hypothetical protein